MRRSTSFLLSFILILLLCKVPIRAQIPDLTYKQLDEGLGLAQNFVYTILRDQKGLIWVGTGKGLSRYDGQGIQTFTVKDGLAKNFVTTSFITSAGWILFGHFQGSISTYNGVFFKQIISDTLNSDVISISEDADNQIWCATRSNGLIRWNGDLTTYRFVFPEQLQGKIINQIKAIKNLLLVATSEGLYIFRIANGQLIFDNAPEKFLFQEVTALETVVDKSHQYWVGTADLGIYILQLGPQNQVLSHPAFDFLKTLNIRAITQRDAHAIWVGTLQKGVFHLKFKEGYTLTEKNHFDESTGFPISSANTIFVDKNTKESAWVGTLNNGLVHLPNLLFENYTPPYTYKIKAINGITEGENGSFYLATDVGLFDFRLKSLNSKKETAFTPLDILNKETLLSVFYFNHTLWVGTRNKGIYAFRQKKGRLKRITLTSPELKTIKARFFKSDKEGNLWVSAIGKGVLKIDYSGKILEQYATNTGFIHNDIFAIHPSTKGEVWFGSLGAGLAKIDTAGKVQRLSQQGVFPSHDIQSIAEDDKGRIWIATDGNGYFQFDGQSFHNMNSTTKDQSLYIKGISYDQQGRIWTVDQKSLLYLDLKSKKTRRFEKSRKLPRERNYTSAIFFDTQNNALVANGGGLMHFKLDNVPPVVKIATHLVGIEISFKPYSGPQPSKEEMLKGMYPSVLLSYEENYITFNCIAINPSYDGTIYYRYYIEGLEPEWSPPTTQHMITYSAISPGQHTLHVQATHNPKQWDNKEMVYSFMLAIPYWETGWFYLLQITGIISLFGLTYLVARNPASKQSISRVMIFACIFIFFEYAQVWLEPITIDIVGSVTIYKTLFNFLLALVLLPLERFFKLFLRGRRKHQRHR